jgi:hypothetical protein
MRTPNFWWRCTTNWPGTPYNPIAAGSTANTANALEQHRAE